MCCFLITDQRFTSPATSGVFYYSGEAKAIDESKRPLLLGLLYGCTIWR